VANKHIADIKGGEKKWRKTRLFSCEIDLLWPNSTQNRPKLNILLEPSEFERNERKYFTMIVALIATKSGSGIPKKQRR